jgi:imidazolonepropionase-like amidohydrolase
MTTRTPARAARWLAWIGLLAAIPAAAEEPEPAPRVTVIRAARMLDVVAGEIFAQPVVVVAGETIRSVGAGEPPADLPEGARTLDLGDVTLLPGLIDLHTHLTYTPENLLPELGHHPYTPAATHAIVGVRSARATLLAGFTTVRDLGTCCFADVTLARAIEQGLAIGPEVFPAGYVLTITGGGCDQTLAEPRVFDGGPEQGIVDSREEIVEAIRYQVRYGAKVIKACVDGGKFSAEEIRIMAEEAHRREVKLATHVWEVESVRAAVEGGADTIEHVSFIDDDTARAMIERGTVLVPTIHVSTSYDLETFPPKARERFEREMPEWRASLRRAIAAGVKIGFGSDTGEIPHGENAKELAGLVEHGMTPLQAIRAATLVAAEVLGVTDRGAIEAGRLADLIAVPGNPVEDVTLLQDVRFVMKRGEVYRPEGEAP